MTPLRKQENKIKRDNIRNGEAVLVSSNTSYVLLLDFAQTMTMDIYFVIYFNTQSHAIIFVHLC